MQIPLQITVRNASVSEAVKEDIRKKAAKLEQFSGRITACRVTVDGPHRHKSQGTLFDVKIDITLPGSELVIKRQKDPDIYVAVRDAFDAARRKLENGEQRIRREVKTHSTSETGRVVRVFPGEGYGFLESSEGIEIYFHHNSVLRDGFGELKVGEKVRYVEEPGEKGPQASTVEPLRRPRKPRGS